ncbi:hypothetical protein C0991_012601, partial [Blastosporella zonata]
MKFLYPILSAAIAAVSIQAKITHSELAENKAKNLRLISTEDGLDPVWKTEYEKLDLLRKRVNFFDVTEVYNPDVPIECLKTVNYGPYRPPTHQDDVKAIIAKLSLPNIQEYVDTLTNFESRYPTVPDGVAAAEWIHQTIEDIILDYPSSGAAVSFFNHSWDQPSVIARIPGAIEGNITIIGAHMDTFNSEKPTGRRSPGADDDATGCASLMEAFRVLLE